VGYIRLVRPVNCVITFVSVLVGAWVGQSISWNWALASAAGIAFFICAFGNILNDLMDIGIDRINNPNRPLVSGKARKNIALIIVIVIGIAALIAAFFLGWKVFILVGATIAGLILYAMFLKKTVIGNFLVAVLAGLSFALGGLISANWHCVIPFIFALFIHVPREIIKDVLDIEGDRAAGAVSLPVTIGHEKAFMLGALCLILLCLAVPVPFFLKILNIAYLILVLVGSFPILIVVIVRLLKAPEHKELVFMSALLKIAMGVGLLGFILG
jgi:geranylgeranylglycerol-phosphate geranylgeranyltransferase